MFTGPSAIIRSIYVHTPACGLSVPILENDDVMKERRGVVVKGVEHISTNL